MERKVSSKEHDKIVHIIPYEKFTESYIKFIFNNFGTEHSFIVCGFVKDIVVNIEETDRVLYCNNFKDALKNREISSKLKSAFRIILHSMFGLELIIFFSGWKVIKKTVVCFWGGDIYGAWDKIHFINMRKFIYDIIDRNAKKIIIKNCYAVATLIPGDYEVLKRHCKVPQRHFIVGYVEVDAGMLDTIQECQKSGEVNILVGNSATCENQHLEAFELLSKFKKKNIRVICPLSYGEKAYAEEIALKGKEFFGECFYPIMDFIPKIEYWKLLSSCSIGIFNNNRQQAMGNINALLRMGKKVYIRRDTPMWDEFKENRQYRIYDISGIANMDYEEFLFLSAEDKKKNAALVKYYSSVQRGIEVWKPVFAD